MHACDDCQLDDMDRRNARRRIQNRPKCKVHGDYRKYVEHTKSVRSISVHIMLITLLLVDLVFDVKVVSKIDLRNYVSIICGSTVGSLYYTFYWPRINRLSVLAGVISGFIVGASFIVISAITYHDFMNEAALCVIFVGLVIPVLLTTITTKPLTEEEVSAVWEKTRSLNDPLLPWTEAYGKETGLRTEGRPRLDDVQRTYSFSTKLLRYICFFLVIFYLALLPAAVLMSQTLTAYFLGNMAYLLLLWLATSFIFLVTAPLVFEFEKAIKLQSNLKASSSTCQLRCQIGWRQWFIEELYRVGTRVRLWRGRMKTN
uniref:Battenin n=1 Tax=Mesocestoides corti TaxID=53468 RepID=A0A5K3FKR5_MESCO